MIRFYQLFISTQDEPVCNFMPSCSQFGIDSLREFGAIKGILLSSDRLQRCNGMSVPYYKIDYKSGKFIDPVQVYSELLGRK
jgi:putative membrane protein insertion efficiency factor